MRDIDTVVVDSLKALDLERPIREAEVLCSIRVLRILTDTVEKGISGNLEATLIQDREPMRNLDSKIHVTRSVRFKF